MAPNRCEPLRTVPNRRWLTEALDVCVVHADAWHGAILSRDRVQHHMESSLRLGVDAVGGTGTPARRLQERRAEILAEWGGRV